MQGLSFCEARLAKAEPTDTLNSLSDIDESLPCTKTLNDDPIVPTVPTVSIVPTIHCTCVDDQVVPKVCMARVPVCNSFYENKFFNKCKCQTCSKCSDAAVSIGYCLKCGCNCYHAIQHKHCARCVIQQRLMKKFSSRYANRYDEIGNEPPPICGWKIMDIAEKISLRNRTSEIILDPLLGYNAAAKQEPPPRKVPVELSHSGQGYWDAVKYHSYPWEIREPLRSEWVSEIIKIQKELDNKSLQWK